MSLLREKIAGCAPTVTLREAIRQDRVRTRPELSPTEEKRWCLHPDYPDPELAEMSGDTLYGYVSAYYDRETCEAIVQMHRRLAASREKTMRSGLGEATGSGSWPPGKTCHPDLYPHDGYHATTIWFDYPSFKANSSLSREVSDEEWQRIVVDAKVWPSIENPVKTVADAKQYFVYRDEQRASRAGKRVGDTFTVLDMGIWLALEASRRAGCLLIEVFDGNAGTKHRIHVKMIPIPGSTAGYAYFPDGTCGDHVTCNLDSLNTSYDLGWFAGLLTHELGHNLRLEHEFRNPQSAHRSVMSYATDNSPFFGYRLAQDPYYVNTPGNLVEDHSWPVLRRYFGGEPAKPIDTPGNPDPPVPNPPNPPGDPPMPDWLIQIIQTLVTSLLQECIQGSGKQRTFETLVGRDRRSETLRARAVRRASRMAGVSPRLASGDERLMTFVAAGVDPESAAIYAGLDEDEYQAYGVPFSTEKLTD